MTTNRLVVLAAVGASVLALAGCAQTSDAAATVNGHVITNATVTFLAELQCNAIQDARKDPAQASSVQTVSRRQIRSDMVNALVQAELNRELADQQHASYDRTTYRQVMDQFEQAVQSAPAADRTRFRRLVGGLYRGQLQVYSIAAEELAAQGVAKPTQQQIEGLVTQLQSEFRAKADIKVDPVYGADDAGQAGAADTSLSAPLSSFAKASLVSPEDPTWVDSLPTNQKCG